MDTPQVGPSCSCVHHVTAAAGCVGHNDRYDGDALVPQALQAMQRTKGSFLQFAQWTPSFVRSAPPSAQLRQQAKRCIRCELPPATFDRLRFNSSLQPSSQTANISSERWPDLTSLPSCSHACTLSAMSSSSFCSLVRPRLTRDSRSATWAPMRSRSLALSSLHTCRQPAERDTGGCNGRTTAEG